MDDTFSTGEFIELEVIMLPVPPGTKASPRPPDRPREIIVEENADPPSCPPSEPMTRQPHQPTSDSDS